MNQLIMFNILHIKHSLPDGLQYRLFQHMLIHTVFIAAERLTPLLIPPAVIMSYRLLSADNLREINACATAPTFQITFQVIFFLNGACPALFPFLPLDSGIFPDYLLHFLKGILVYNRLMAVFNNNPVLFISQMFWNVIAQFLFFLPLNHVS